VYVCVDERRIVCVCVCVCERERERMMVAQIGKGEQSHSPPVFI